MPASHRPKVSTFLNVDLEIESASRLDLLAAAVEPQAFVVHHGPGPGSKRYFLSLESARLSQGPDAAIHALCTVIENLAPAARRVWNAAARKTFDIGHARRESEPVLRFGIRAGTLARLTKLGATVAFTCYPPEIPS